MLVTNENIDEVVGGLSKYHVLGIDTETTGLHFWKHQLFSVIIHAPGNSYYFNFNTKGDRYMPRTQIQKLKPLLLDPKKRWRIANAKFDMHMLANEGLEFEGELWCCMAQERVIKNNQLAGNPYKLQGMAKKYCDVGKDEAVEDYIYEHGLYTKVMIPGKKKLHEDKRFDEVPLDITMPYGELDARLHYQVGDRQETALAQLDKDFPASDIYGSVLDVSRNEMQLTKTCFKMERRGMRLDVDYTNRAMAHENTHLVKLKEDFYRLTDLSYTDSRTTFVKAFDRLGLTYPLTEKGNPSFKAEVLEEIDNPVAKIITDIRHYEKRIGTYYSSFLYFKDQNDFVHPNIKQGGTETGRMSCSDPNLQNVPKEDDPEDFKKPYLVRSCFIPDNEDFFWAAIDWKQQEFRMLLDYAGEHRLIEAINAGADPHQATADETGLTRKASKTINFGLIYGMGTEKLARALGVSFQEAQEMKEQYFKKMKNVGLFIKKVNGVAKRRMYVRNWFGRVCFLDDVDYSYILLNHLIQGGCGDVCKIAMNQTEDFLTKYKTKTTLRLQVHDELLFGAHRTEAHIIPELAQIMDKVYRPQNGMKLITSMEHSFRSWGKKDMIEGVPA